ncbi:MAG: hypothetical protein ABIZ70_14685 [Gemmatimonadales bacterium]
MPLSFQTLVGAAILLGTSACGHSEAFESPIVPPLTAPFTTLPPIPLTFDEGMDRWATWSPDERGIWYSFQPGGRSDGDVCLASMPGGGGTRREFCLTATAQESRRDAFDRPAPGPEGLLLYGHYTSNIGMLTLEDGELDLATTAAPLEARRLLSLPNNIGGIGFNHIGRIRWLARDHFVAVAEDETVIPHCASCTKRDTIYVGYGLLDARITADGATFRLIPGSLNANDFTLSVAGDSLYFTQSDDLVEFTTRGRTISSLPIGGGTAQVIYAGAGGLASVGRAGPRLILATGGRVVALEVASGVVSVLASNGLTGARGYGSVTASTDGCRVLAEFARPRGLTFETNVYLLATGNSNCAP